MRHAKVGIIRTVLVSVTVPMALTGSAPFCVAEDFMKLRLESLLYRDVPTENYFGGF